MYFEETEGIIKKYRVDIDVEKLTELKYEILKKCGMVIHRAYETVNPPLYDYRIMEGFHARKIGTKEYKDGPDEDLYFVSYDEYLPTKLVKLIDLILKGEYEYLYEIIHPKAEEKRAYVEEKNAKIAEITKAYSLLATDASVMKTIDKLKMELDEIIAAEKLNQNQGDEAPYYALVLECIKLEKVSELSAITISEVLNFLDVNLEELKKPQVRVRNK